MPHGVYNGLQFMDYVAFGHTGHILNQIIGVSLEDGQRTEVVAHIQQLFQRYFRRRVPSMALKLVEQPFF
jgi:hypothetical protein